MKENINIVITKPDKGAGVVVLDQTDYNRKMMSILHDKTKFEPIGLVSYKDKTSKREKDLIDLLLKFHKEKFLSKEIYEVIRPTGSQRPRMYGLQKNP